MRKATLGLLVALAGCGDSGGDSCLALQSGQLAGNGTEPMQVEIEARIVIVNRTFLDELGVSWNGIAPVGTDNGGLLGGVSRQGSDVVVGSDTVGGAPGIPNLVTNGFDGLLSLVNLNFQSPFNGEQVKIFVGLPNPGGCTTCDDAATTPITGFAGGADAGSLPAYDPALAGTLSHSILGDAAVQALLDALEADTSQILIQPPVIQLVSEQRTVIGIQDVLPQITDLEPLFRNAVTPIVPNPLGMFTGAALDIVPTIDGTNVNMTIRPGTKLLSVFRSVPATVGATPADVEIPFISPSRNHATIAVPDGQTLVIGSLVPTGQSATTGLPLLSSIPLVGSAFTHQLTNPDEQTLLILITPRIISSE